MSTTYRDTDEMNTKLREEMRCIGAAGKRLGKVLDEGMAEYKLAEHPEMLEELRVLRCVLERMLRVFDEGLFVDYQREKFGKDFKMDR